MAYPLRKPYDIRADEIDSKQVERKGVEPSTSALRTQRSPN